MDKIWGYTIFCTFCITEVSTARFFWRALTNLFWLQTSVTSHLSKPLFFFGYGHNEIFYIVIPPWIVAMNDLNKKFVLPSSNIGNVLMFKNLQNQLIQSIHTPKQKYFNKISKKLSDPLTNTKCYWSLLKTILNGKK